MMSLETLQFAVYDLDAFHLGLADKDDHGLHGWVRIKRRRRKGFCLLVFPIREIRVIRG